MKRNIIIALAASLALAGCGSSEEKKDVTAEAKVEAPKVAPAKPGQPKTEAQIKNEQKQVQQTVEQAMAEIPPELREKHQAAFNCTIEKNNRLPAAQQKQIGVDTIKAITGQLKANPNANLCV
jgi:hypothetical protein